MTTRINAADLTEIIKTCTHRSLDARVPPDARRRFLDLSEKLTDRLTRVTAKSFDERSEAFTRANAELRAVNAKLKGDLDDLTKLNETLADVVKLVGVVDTLLAAAVKIA